MINLFYLDVYKDIELLKNTISHLDKKYKHPIIVRSDGVFYNVLEYNSNLTYFNDKRYKLQCYGGKIIQKFLEISLRYKTEFITKLDPDTLPQNILDYSKIKGIKSIISKSNRHTHICGGLIIFPRKIAQKIYNSKLLLNNKYKEDRFTYWNKKVQERIISQDKILSDVINNLNINVIEYPSIQIDPQYTNLRLNQNATFLHPVNLKDKNRFLFN